MKILLRILIILIAASVVVGAVIGLSRLGLIASGPAPFGEQMPPERRQDFEGSLAENPDSPGVPPLAPDGQFGGGFNGDFRGGDPSGGFDREWGRTGSVFGLLELVKNAGLISIITLAGVLILKAVQALSRKLRRKLQASTP